MRYLIYGRESCPFCVAACNFLEASELEYHFCDFELEGEFLDYVKEFYNFETVPIIIENNNETGTTKMIGGYTEMLDWLA